MFKAFCSSVCWKNFCLLKDKQEELDRCLVRLVDLDARAQEIAEQTPDEASKDSLKNAVNAVNEHYSQVQELYHNVRSQQVNQFLVVG